MALRVWVVRHGDRLDFEMGQEKWRAIAQRVNDPCLSDLGHQQAVETAQAVASENDRPDRRPTSIISSPFLRCIETSNPLAGLLGLPIKIDHSLFEVVFTGESMPSLADRACYFPRIDLDYESVFKPPSGEGFPVECIARYGEAASRLVEKFEGESIVLVTHAAGVCAIVAKLLKAPIRAINAASPCCLFCLDRDSSADEWRLSEKYSGSTSHLSSLADGTKPWPRPDDDWALKFLTAGDAAPWLAED